MARDFYKDYLDLTVDELQDEFIRLKDIYEEAKEFKIPAGYAYPELLVYLNRENKLGIHRRLTEIKRQASFKGVDLGPI